MCTLLGFGADAICPYVVFETMARLKAQNLLEADLTDAEIFSNYVAATARGISKVMAKMGISTLHSYKVKFIILDNKVQLILKAFLIQHKNFLWLWLIQGAQIFEIVGLDEEVVNKCFVGSASRIGGSSFRVLAAESLARHNAAYSSRTCDNKLMPSPGYFHWRSGGEKHINDPLSIANLQVTMLFDHQIKYLTTVKPVIPGHSFQRTTCG